MKLSFKNGLIFLHSIKRYNILRAVTTSMLHLKFSWQSECILCDNIINFKDKLRHHEQNETNTNFLQYSAKS